MTPRESALLELLYHDRKWVLETTVLSHLFDAIWKLGEEGLVEIIVAQAKKLRCLRLNYKGRAEAQMLRDSIEAEMTYYSSRPKVFGGTNRPKPDHPMNKRIKKEAAFIKAKPFEFDNGDDDAAE